MKLSQPLRLSCLTLSCVLAFASPLQTSASLVETFSYGNGNITSVSGGSWQFWEPGATDGTVVDGAFRYEGTTDVIRNFPSVLNAPGDTATISFTININIANTTEGYAIDFLPASPPFGSAGTNYGNQFSLGFDYSTSELPGWSSIDIAAGGTPEAVRVLSIRAGVTHAIRVELERGETNTAYTLFLGNTFIYSGTFLLSDPRGMNAVELEQSGESLPNATGFALVDNLMVVPEPATGALLGLCGVALLGARRRKSGGGV